MWSLRAKVFVEISPVQEKSEFPASEIRRLEGRVAELRARYYPSKPQPAYLAMRTFGAPASAQEWGPCGHAGEHLLP